MSTAVSIYFVCDSIMLIFMIIVAKGIDVAYGPLFQFYLQIKSFISRCLLTFYKSFWSSSSLQQKVVYWLIYVSKFWYICRFLWFYVTNCINTKQTMYMKYMYWKATFFKILFFTLYVGHIDANIHTLVTNKDFFKHQWNYIVKNWIFTIPLTCIRTNQRTTIIYLRSNW